MVEEQPKEKIVSREFKGYIREVNPDPGLDESVKKLTPEKIEKVVKAVLGTLTARIKTPIETCVHCGLCAESCHWYLSNDKDPTYSPVAKVRMTLWELVKRQGKVDAEFIKQCARIVFTECNICHRCSMYCPYGIDIAFLVGIVRRICYVLGVMPQRMMDQDSAQAAMLNQVWMSQSDWLDTVQWQEEEAGADFKKLRIPIDKEGAEVVWYPLGAEPKNGVEHIARLARIMHVAGVDWTMPGKDVWDSSNMPMFIRDFTTMQRIVRGLYENAFRLKVKKMVLTE